MLRITIPATDQFNEDTQEFISTKEQTLELEHSLVSLSKWESKWHKAFLTKDEKSREETIDYIRCMTVTKNVDSNVYHNLTNDNVVKVNSYIEDSMTATTFSKNKSGSRNHEIVTSELIYYWMIALNIPFECQHWHLNRLMTLIQVCNIKNSPPEKRSRREIASRNTALNEARKKRLNTKG